MKIIQGKKIAGKILADLKKQIKTKQIKPCLAVILIGKNSASRLYVQIKEKAAQQIGITVKKYLFSARVSERRILETIDLLNQDDKIDGILVQMPLPKQVSADKIIKAIDLKKDVDGFLPQGKFEPPFISAIWEALKATGENLKNKKIVALVNSDVFGKALVDFLQRKKLKVNYVILRESRSTAGRLKNLRRTDSSLTFRMTRRADVLITALGRPNFIKGSMVKKGAILIDGGISKKGERIVGDIDVKSVSQKAKWLSPVPGGLGPITVALLLKNVVLAAQNL